MLMTDYTTEFLNLENAIITCVENISDQLHISIALPRRKHVCPCCGTVADRVHDYRLQIIKDVPIARDTFLHLRKRCYRCSCGKRSFEKNTFLPHYYRVTNRLELFYFGSTPTVDTEPNHTPICSYYPTYGVCCLLSDFTGSVR